MRLRLIKEKEVKMNFKDLLLKYKAEKTRVIINGLGDGETKA